SGESDGGWWGAARETISLPWAYSRGCGHSESPLSILSRLRALVGETFRYGIRSDASLGSGSTSKGREDMLALRSKRSGNPSSSVPGFFLDWHSSKGPRDYRR
ncbi:hypothetical protein PM082_019186, partial [Marasmius tenuissimus]